MQSSTDTQRFGRLLIGVVAASAFAYPLLFCALQLAFAQLAVRVDVAATALWLTVAVLCCVALVAALRWGAARRIRSYWLLLGLAPPAVYEAWLLWPLLTT
jgi:hypothetical protein